VDGEEYTTQEAARILRATERTIRRRLERGDLEGRRDPATGRWWVSARAVTAAMEDRPPKKASASLESPDAAASEEVAHLRARIEDLQRQLGRLEAQKTAEALERDRIRLERERFFWEARQKELEEALEAANRSKERSKGFWARLFGG
jgi:hypothetical protein